jgi:hypothetical protein
MGCVLWLLVQDFTDVDRRKEECVPEATFLQVRTAEVKTHEPLSALPMLHLINVRTSIAHCHSNPI